jgi:hypothetical protein
MWRKEKRFMSNQLHLGQPGETFEEYKQFITELFFKLTGKEPTSTEEEWRKDYDEYLKELKSGE